MSEEIDVVEICQSEVSMDVDEGDPLFSNLGGAGDQEGRHAEQHRAQ